MSCPVTQNDDACPRYITRRSGGRGSVTITTLWTYCSPWKRRVTRRRRGRHRRWSAGILSNVVLTQEVLHQRFGGVVPELAAREHIRGVVPVVEQALRDAAVTCVRPDGGRRGERSGPGPRARRGG